jgi:hypothetical protein
MTESRTRRTAAQRDDDEKRQLQRACQDLVKEFGQTLPEDEVKARFEEILREFEGAPVRSFVPVLAGRAARARLRQLASA